MDIADVFDDLGLGNLSFGKIVGGLIVGALFIAFSIPNALIRFGHALGWIWMSAAGTMASAALADFDGRTANMPYLSFGNLRSMLFYGLLAYVVALALLALRHQRFDLFIAGVVSLVVGTAILNLLAWTIFLFVYLVYLIAIVVVFIFGILAMILGAIFGFIAYVLMAIWAFIAPIFAFVWGLMVAFWTFLLSSPWWILAALLLLALIIFLAVKYREALVSLLQLALGVAILVGAYYLGRWLFILLAPLWAFLAQIFAAIARFLAPIFAAIGWFLGVVVRFLIVVVGFLLAGFLVLYAIYGVGAWVLDLFRGAWSSGSGRRGVMIGGLAIGTALAFILMETNLYHTDGFPFYPLQAVGVANFFHELSPIFDIIMALLVVVVSIFGVLRNLGEMRDEPTLAEFQSSLVMAGVGLMIAFVFLLIGALAVAGNGSSQS